MTQVLTVRYQIQRYSKSYHGWHANIDHKLCGELFNTLDEARKQAKLARRRRAPYEAPFKMRILIITTEVYEEL